LLAPSGRASADTPVKRKTRLVPLAMMEGNGALAALDGLARQMKRLPAPPRRSLTADQVRGRPERIVLDQVSLVKDDRFWALGWKTSAQSRAEEIARAAAKVASELELAVQESRRPRH